MHARQRQNRIGKLRYRTRTLTFARYTTMETPVPDEGMFGLGTVGGC